MGENVLNRFCHIKLFVTLKTVALQFPLSLGFFRQESWSGLPFSVPKDLSNPGIKPMSLTSPALAGGFFTISTTWEEPYSMMPSSFYKTFF